VDTDPKEIAKVSDGKVKRVVGKPLTSETAALAAKRRWEIYHEKAAEGMAEAVDEYMAKVQGGTAKSLARSLPQDAWKHVLKRATETYLNAHELRGMAEMGKFIGHTTGMLREITKDSREDYDTPQMSGLEDARVIMQVFNFYKSDYNDIVDEIDVIDAECNDLVE
jgi:hypothetical protein